MTTLVADPPTPDTSPDWHFPAVERHHGDGVEVVAAHLPARPLVTATVLLGVGANADPAGQEGLASLLGSAALRGAGGRDEHALAVAFERVGAVPGVTVHYERTEVSLEVPGALLADALALVADVLRNPTLAADEVLRVRDARIDRLRARVTDSRFRAGRAASRNLWAAGARWSVGSTGEVESLDAVGPDDVTALHRAGWASAPVAVVLAGDLRGVDPVAAAAPLAGGGSVAADVDVSATPAADGTRVHLVEVPGAVQSVLDVRAVGPGFGVGDEAGLEVAATALFGSFTSRLNLRLREELGYTYGASGGFVRLRDGGWMRAGCSVRTDVTAPAVTELVAVLRATTAEGFTDDEVEQARDNMVSRFPVRYDGPGPVAAALVRRVHNGLDDAERDARLAALRAVSTDAAAAALRAALPVDDLAITVAGDAEAVRDDLAALELGPVSDVV
jgi:predicted Zn-dependent peptidase